jgi:hypothetical protein
MMRKMQILSVALFAVLGTASAVAEASEEAELSFGGLGSTLIAGWLLGLALIQIATLSGEIKGVESLRDTASCLVLAVVSRLGLTREVDRGLKGVLT